MEPLTQNTKGALGLLDLPNEVLAHICAQLCPHCRIDGLVIAPLRVARAARTLQAALSRLSMCCRELRDIAQPFLFHWYPDLERQIWPHSFARLFSFLIAIVRRPELAGHVRAATLYTPFLDRVVQMDRDRWRHLNARFKEISDSYDQAVGVLGSHFMRYTSNRPAFVNVQDAVLAITPKLTSLCLQRPSHFLQDGLSLPNITYLAFPGASQQPFLHNNDDSAFHLYQARAFLRTLPNLKTLIAPDCVADWHYVYWQFYRHEPWDVPLPRLEKFSSNGMVLKEMERIIECCPALRDLEFFDGNTVSPDDNQVLQPESHLSCVRTTLKRLCYSTLGYRHDDSREKINEAAVAGFRMSGFQSGSGMDFSSFPALETLEIEQHLLYGPIFPLTLDYSPVADRSAAYSTPGGFLARLPPSLRVLRVGFAIYWTTLYRDLAALAAHSPLRFPALRRVIVETLDRPPGDEHLCLLREFRSVGVTFTVRSARVRSGKRGLLPPRPGNPPAVFEEIVCAEPEPAAGPSSGTRRSDGLFGTGAG